jgi:hypothetical protein
MQLSYIVKSAVALSLLLGTSACLMAAPSESEQDDVAGQHTSALNTGVCPRPSLGSGNSCSPADGTLKLQVTLPAGQAYVEVFSRQNGVQNVATNIVSSASDNGDGSATYSLERTGYAASDKVEYRFYSYLPSSPGVFTPGVAEQVWLSHQSEPARIVVDRTDDSQDGVCSAAGQCNLRAAVALAQASVQPVTIVLTVDSLVELGQIAIAPESALALRIEAESARRIEGVDAYRLFTVGANVNLSLDNVAIANFADWDGGALSNAGNVHVTRTVFEGNTARCSGVGAMTAFATCTGGAIVNTGSLTLGEGTRFVDNGVRSEAWTASFTNASAIGGAIANNGSIVVEGSVEFASNVSSAMAQSGIHPGPGGAWSSSIGGAIYNGGSLIFRGDAIGHCSFTGNAASATASAVSPYVGTSSSTGGAIASAGTLVLPEGACVFADNEAQTDRDVHLPKEVSSAP